MTRSLAKVDMAPQTRAVVPPGSADRVASLPDGLRAAADEAAFVALSAELTGFDDFDLAATGLTALYLETAIDRIGPDTWQRLFATWHAMAGLPPKRRVAEVADRIMGDVNLADAAQRIIALWYVGSWYAVIPAGSHTVSAAAYVEGLMWKAMRTHPMGAKPQGYGAWASNPPTAFGEDR